MSRIVEFYRDVMREYSDPRTSDWFLISGPGPILLIIASYIYFSISAGPRYMRDKKAYTLRNLMILYNFIQVLLSIYLVHEGLLGGWLFEYNFRCQPVDRSDNPTAMRMCRAVYAYFICKLIELLDTVFFVLRKKNQQISFLHVYHHALMPFTAWVAVRFFPGGHFTLIGVINSFIHIFMYAYYMLSSIGPQMQKYLWWKKYLTVMQITQFFIVFVHSGQVLFNGCPYPRLPPFLLVVNSLLFVYLFGSFYLYTYVRPRRPKKEVTINGTCEKNIGNGIVKNKKAV